MIPPVAPALSASNPRFEKLYQHLLNHALDHDASTTAINVPNQINTEQLQVQRVHAAEDRLLIASLFELYNSEELSKDLRDLILIIASYVNDASKLSLTGCEHDLMREDVRAFRGRLNEIAEALAPNLSSKHETFAVIASSACDDKSTSKMPTADDQYMPSSSRVHPSDLSSHINTLTSGIDRFQTRTLPSAQYDATNSLVLLLRSQAQHLQHLIRHLELRKRGAEARRLVARAQFLSTVAKGLEAKTKVTYLERRQDVYSPQLRQKLKDRVRRFDEEEASIAVRRRDLQAALNEYEVAGGEVMRTLGKKYAEIENAIGEVQGDVERLSNGGIVSINKPLKG